MNKIKTLRKAKGLNQGELAKSAGISQTYLCELEKSRKTNPSRDVLVRIAKALSVSVSELLDD
ncbi:Cro/C1-type helix-turn-helix domain [Syntrophomonas zehnderi OL-4]|uniref:Cro/C1-type helix-turn-helix domain n=1 Tax=Syntrophomonas zehnderi OL-4 TaxID=690567 RepID=A0A0E4C7Y1_9FIRM|nr:helix-turn-helix transcriptional regulator [Syntrophomonas zehnderi]CFX15540.1 Cro/C1-type helix-turn-helix domain [Syntrophomonas zehnderi OL-4]